jgi:hypothetical protein
MKRLAIPALVVAVASLGLIPAGASAERIGPRLPQAGMRSFVGSPGVSWMGTARPMMVTPFAGTITHFNVQGADGTFSLQVLRYNGDGYIEVAETQPKTASVAHHAIARFAANLDVQAGQLLALHLQSKSWFRGVLWHGGSETTLFNPAPTLGEVAYPYAVQRILALYNATIQP